MPLESSTRLARVRTNDNAQIPPNKLGFRLVITVTADILGLETRVFMRMNKNLILCCAVLVTAVAASATVAPVVEQGLPTTADASAAEETINLAVTGMT